MIAAASLVLALGSLSATVGNAQQRRYDYRQRDNGYWQRDNGDRRWSRSTTVPAGTAIEVRLDEKVSTEHAQQGDTWSGTIVQPVTSRGRVVIPAGTQVEGVVTDSRQGTHTSKAELDLAVRRVNVNGSSRTLYADTEPIVADSHRAKKIGAIAGGALVGGLLGNAVGGKKGGILGGLLGGAAGYGATRHALRTLQLKPGTELTFVTREDVAMRF
jgi:outer membrane lipoprotein SlyB